MNVENLFWDLYRAPVEAAVEKILARYSLLKDPAHWRPYGQNESNFGVVENQQASPIPALIEKITNGIDAILVRRCLEEGLDPRSSQAPQSIDAAIGAFFPDHKNWDIPKSRRVQAEGLQILADGPRLETSLIIYDDGEGQRPEDFESTFLSLLRGNKNEIHFVQGKYNMGGAGAVAFCGKRRYQLVASKRFGAQSPFGFTLVRRHPLTAEEEQRKKSTWYEYLIIDNKIPSFACGPLELGLHNRSFKTGTVIKLYSYDLPAGARSVISRDLNQSINEYLFQPALPILTVDKKERYPDDRNLERELYGLRRRLEEDESKYVDKFFSEDIADAEFGRIRATCYVFKPRVEAKNAKETRETIQREFFKNNMSILFSVNGQVHGNYTSEFITRSLKFPLLKDYLLVHVDCTDVRTQFRNELFMASRDRLKEGAESRKLRRMLADLLSAGRLKDIHKERKASITVECNDAEELLRSVTRNLPIQDDLAKLLGQTFRLEDERHGRKAERAKPTREEKDKEKPTFKPQRFPSIFQIDGKAKDSDGVPLIHLPLGGERTIKFSTDVEDQYFDRVREPGDLQIGLLNVNQNGTGGSGGDRASEPKALDAVFNVVRSSPQDGTIRVLIKPTKDMKVGDAVELKASLSSPGGQLEQVFVVKVSAPEKKAKDPKPGDEPDKRLGLPKPVMVYREAGRGGLTWDDLESRGISMNHEIVVVPQVEGEALSEIYINMDSNALLSHRAKLNKEEAIAVADKRYLSAVYFHTLFLYVITKNRKYDIVKRDDEAKDQPVELTEYVADLFKSFYAQFLLNFDTQELIAALEA
ncbi:MAG TPA: hypothetical protein VGG10_03080 [Rhizomicrobium sp.]|jgi:hypothetical protein